VVSVTDPYGYILGFLYRNNNNNNNTWWRGKFKKFLCVKQTNSTSTWSYVGQPMKNIVCWRANTRNGEGNYVEQLRNEIPLGSK
jgi:hypothetical protein